jgi:twitching motility protein PilU
LYKAGKITLDEAVRNADSANNLRLKIKLNTDDKTAGAAASAGLSLEAIEEKEPEESPVEKPVNPFMTIRDN